MRHGSLSEGRTFVLQGRRGIAWQFDGHSNRVVECGRDASVNPRRGFRRHSHPTPQMQERTSRVGRRRQDVTRRVGLNTPIRVIVGRLNSTHAEQGAGRDETPPRQASWQGPEAVAASISRSRIAAVRDRDVQHVGELDDTLTWQMPTTPGNSPRENRRRQQNRRSASC